MAEKTDLLRGTLDLLILQSLVQGPNHGLGVARRIEQMTGGAFDVGPGSLFPALHRLEENGWLAGEWDLATENYYGAWNIAAQGFLLLSILYLTTTPKDSHRHLRLGMVWVGALALIPFIVDVVCTAEKGDFGWSWHWQRHSLPPDLQLLGYAGAYLPALLAAAITRRSTLTFRLPPRRSTSLS